MDDADRFKLLGTYRTPRFRYGQTVFCEIHGEAIITGLSDALIPWPIGKRPGGRARFATVSKDLLKAIRRESGQAIAHHWGCSLHTVSAWRRALGVGRRTEGSSRLWSEHGKENVADTLGAAWPKARDPERLRKISEARKGQPMPDNVREALQRGRKRLGKKEIGRRVSEAMSGQVRGPRTTKVSWTPEEDEALRTLPPAEVAAKTGRSLAAVYTRRWELGLPDARRRG
jgi:hypothetical protein